MDDLQPTIDLLVARRDEAITYADELRHMLKGQESSVERTKRTLSEQIAIQTSIDNALYHLRGVAK